MTLINVQGHSAISSENKCSLIFRSVHDTDRKSTAGDLTKDEIVHDLEWRLKVMVL